jgi:hypothetical protein
VNVWLHYAAPASYPPLSVDQEDGLEQVGRTNLTLVSAHEIAIVILEQMEDARERFVQEQGVEGIPAEYFK